MKAIEGKQGKAPKFEQDIRKVVEDKNIDIVTIATPNHWHALAAIWAMQAGKDVYVEKPVSHNVSEGRRIVEAARKYKQHLPGRHAEPQQHRHARGHRVRPRRQARQGRRWPAASATSRAAASARSTGDAEAARRRWTTTCGAARPAKMPLQAGNGTVHYDWHWIWDYGNGDLGNQGIHEMDKARWGLARTTLPNSVVSLGGRFGYVDDGETANTQLCVFDYGDAKLIFEVRGLKTDKLQGRQASATSSYGTDGFVVCPSYASGVAYDNDGKVVAKFAGGGDETTSATSSRPSAAASSKT